MYKPNHKLENEIKLQIDDREIKPSRDLWAEIAAQNQTLQMKKTNRYWFLAAACIVLLLSLTLVINLIQTETSNLKVVENKNLESIQQKNPEINFTVARDAAKKNEISKAENNIIVQSQPSIISEKSSEVQEVSPVINNKIIPEIYRNSTTSPGLSVVDSLQLPVKKKKYVDASTLLFSVEHKDVISNSKSGSNVATIDLNTK